MIFVTLGTQKFQFNRLLKKIDSLVSENVILEEVIVQSGYTEGNYEHIVRIPFMSNEEFNKYLLESRIVITHGGTGSIINSINYGKKVIAFPRLKEFREHVDNHQLEIVKAFADRNFLLTGEVDNLNNLLDLVEKIELSKYESNTEKIIKIITDFIDK